MREAGIWIISFSVPRGESQGGQKRYCVSKLTVYNMVLCNVFGIELNYAESNLKASA